MQYERNALMFAVGFVFHNNVDTVQCAHPSIYSQIRNFLAVLGSIWACPAEAIVLHHISRNWTRISIEVGFGCIFLKINLFANICVNSILSTSFRGYSSHSSTNFHVMAKLSFS